jgi:hypothetical protein
MYLPELRGEVSQGDVFDSLPIVYARQEARGPAVLDTAAILVTYDCEYDKPSTKLVMVAGVFPLAEVPADRRGNVRKNKIFSTFYLEATDFQEESFVDFRYMGLLEKAVVASEAQSGRRSISLSDEAQLAFQEQLSAFFGYGRRR